MIKIGSRPTPSFDEPLAALLHCHEKMGERLDTLERAAAALAADPTAAFAAISEAVGRAIEVIDLSVQSVTPGRDSLGRVLLQVRVDGKSLSGHGASTDIVEAGARALVHALNKADHADGLETAALSSSYFWGV